MDVKDMRFGKIGAAYVNSIEGISIEEYDNLNLLLCHLPDLNLEENYILDDDRPRDLTNSILRLYVRKKSVEHPTYSDFQNENNVLFYINKHEVVKILKIGGIPIFKYKKKALPEFPFLHIFLPFTEEAIWQAYLLWQTYHIIGMRWHGGYNRRLFINLPDDIDKIGEECQMKRYDLEKSGDLINECRSAYLLPSIKLSKNMAFITHCWFNQWGGLLQVTCKVEYNKRKRQIAKFEIVEEKVLVSYDCGIMY